MLYLVTYDLRQPGKDYATLWAALRGLGATRELESVWLLYADSTPKHVGDYLVQYMDGNDRILVTEVPSNYAYRGLMSKSAAA